jgi:hypothetical protein
MKSYSKSTAALVLALLYAKKMQVDIIGLADEITLAVRASSVAGMIRSKAGSLRTYSAKVGAEVKALLRERQHEDWLPEVAQTVAGFIYGSATHAGAEVESPLVMAKPKYSPNPEIELGATLCRIDFLADDETARRSVPVSEIVGLMARSFVEFFELAEFEALRLEILNALLEKAGATDDPARWIVGLLETSECLRD